MNREELADRFEMSDGSTPDSIPLSAEVAKRLPIFAFSLLTGGDAFDVVSGKPPPQGPALAKAYLDAKVSMRAHGAAKPVVDRVLSEIRAQISANLQLIARLQAGRPLAIDLIPPGKSMASYGFPKATSRSASGLFWDHPTWPEARIGLRQDRLHEPALVVHEMAHAIEYLAFTPDEREQLYRVMLRTYRTRHAVDEVFAIYSEREFSTFTDDDKRAPGVYGVARQRWSEEHLFTRFVRSLYFPHKPLAGPPSRGMDLR